MRNVRSNLTTKQQSDFVYLCKLNVYIDEIFLKFWCKDLLTEDEECRLKTARTHINKVVRSVTSRLDIDTRNSVSYQIMNKRLINAPKDEYKRALENLNKDIRLVDYMLAWCNPCKCQEPWTCEISKCLRDHKYPMLWDSTNDKELTEDELKLKHHCYNCGGLE